MWKLESLLPSVEDINQMAVIVKFRHSCQLPSNWKLLLKYSSFTVRKLLYDSFPRPLINVRALRRIASWSPLMKTLSSSSEMATKMTVFCLNISSSRFSFHIAHDILDNHIRRLWLYIHVHMERLKLITLFAVSLVFTVLTRQGWLLRIAELHRLRIICSNSFSSFVKINMEKYTTSEFEAGGQKW